MKNEMPALANCLVIGDKRKYLTMLVSLKCEVDVETNIPTDILAPISLHVGKEIGSSATTMSEAARDPKWIEYIDSGMARANERAGMHTI
jgi:long-chain-fatty-acid--CoA ligase ACSBG